MEDPTDTRPSERADASKVLVTWGNTSRVVDLGHQPFVIGRSQACDLCIEDASISRRHLAMRGGDAPTIEDLGSSNGTTVAGVRLLKSEARPLLVGQIVQFGIATLVLVQARATAEAPAAALADLVGMIAGCELSVVLQGETGAGKEVYAETIHQRSRRAAGPLVKVNCAAIPDALVESELFGYERGAFTGALQPKPGLVETADGGTLFLDEIAELSVAAQAKLLRFLETRECQRVGSTKPKTIDARILAATHKDLPRCVAEGTFRSDLYYRLNGMTLVVPPLRERPADIPRLAHEFAAGAAIAGRPVVIRPEALARLQAHRWPGNVRELRTVIGRAVVLSQGGPIEAHHVVFDETPAPSAAPPTSPSLPAPGSGSSRDLELATQELEKRRRELERQRIVEALERSGGNQTKAAELLGASRRWLIQRIEELGLPRPRKR